MTTCELIIVGPDKNAQFLFGGLFAAAAALGVSVPRHRFEIHPLRDAGCLDADELLECRAHAHEHALVVLNADRSGRAEQGADVLQEELERKLSRTWGERARAVVVDPGIERWLLERGLEQPWEGGDVRKAMERALRSRRTPQSPMLFQQLGLRLARTGDGDRAWQRIVTTLRQWFPEARKDYCVAEFLAEVEGLSHANQDEKALDLIFDRIDELLLEGSMAKVDEILAEIRVDRFEPAVLLGFLTITVAARDRLKSRPKLVSRVKKLRERALGEPAARAELAGLE